MAIVNGYATLDELSDQMGFDATKKVIHTTLLEDSITRASRFIDTKTDSFFFSKPLVNEIIDVGGFSRNLFEIWPRGQTLEAPAPIISVASIKEDDILLTEKVSFNSIGDYLVRFSVGLVDRLDQCWSTSPMAIEFSGDIGYASVPSDINEVCITIASVFTGLATTIVISKDGDAEGALEAEIPKWVMRFLKKYKRALV